MGILHIDFETRSACDLKKSGADVYAVHPTTDILCLGWAMDQDPIDLWRPYSPDHQARQVISRHVSQGGLIVAHNAPFELAIWNPVLSGRYHFPQLKPEQTVCTMAMAYAMALPGSLEKAAAAVGITAQKDMSGHRIMMQLSQPRDFDKKGEAIWWDDPAKLEKLYAYCKQDIEVERELYKRLLPLSKREREVWQMDYTINRRGVGVDVHAIKAAIKMAEIEKARLDQAMKELTSNQVASCSAVSQLSDWLKSQGVTGIDGVAKSDVVTLLSRDDLPKHCRQALLLRQEAARSSTAKLSSMLGSVGSDGRLRGIYQYHGAGTGRWAGRRTQPHNFPRPKLSQTEIENVFGILGALSCTSI